MKTFSLFLRGCCLNILNMSLRMGKPYICIGENKGKGQLRSYCEADQSLWFRYTDSTIPLLSKSKISSLEPSSVTVQPGLCRTWSQLVGFLTPKLISIFFCCQISRTRLTTLRHILTPATCTGRMRAKLPNSGRLREVILYCKLITKKKKSKDEKYRKWHDKLQQ